MTEPQPTHSQIRPVVAFIIVILISGLFVMALIALLMQFDINPTESMQETIDSLGEIYNLFGVPIEMLDMITKLLPAMTLAGAIGAIAYSLIEGLTGASIGKRIMKLTVTTPDGKTGTTMLFIRRWAVKNISAIFDFIALVPTLAFLSTFGDFAGFVIFIGCFFVLGEAKLALHDRIAGTAVYHVDDVN